MRSLLPSEIELRVSTIKENGLQLLLYKTARVDMAFLDELYTPFGWSCEYCEIKGNLFCGISVKTEHGWVTKWDCGIESRESGGNEKKGEASDAFKRAGTKWGIGRELYTSPFIWVGSDKAMIAKDGRGNYTTHDRFSVLSIDVDNGNIVDLVIINDKTGNIVYSMTKNKTYLPNPPQDPKSGTKYLDTPNPPQDSKPELTPEQQAAKDRAGKAADKLGMTPTQRKAAYDRHGGDFVKLAEDLEGKAIAKECAADEQAIIDQATANTVKAVYGTVVR